MMRVRDFWIDGHEPTSGLVCRSFITDYITPAAGGGGQVPTALPFLASRQNSPSPAIAANVPADTPVAGTQLSFAPPAGATRYTITCTPRLAAGAAVPAISVDPILLNCQLAGGYDAFSGAVVPGLPILVTPIWAPLTTGTALLAGSSNCDVTVDWQ